MKFSIAKDVFLQALSHGQSVVERRSTVPILSHVMISTSSLGLSLTTTDIDMALIETIPATVESNGTVCTPAHLLHEIVRKLDSRHMIHVEAAQNSLHIHSHKSKFTLSCLPSDEFPQLTHGALTHRFAVKASVLKTLIDKTRFSISTDSFTYYLNGILMNCLDGVLRFVSTDTFRLSAAEIPVPEGAKEMPKIIVGKKAIYEILKLIDGVKEDIVVGLSDTRIECSFQDETSSAVLTSRLIDGVFPDYEEAIFQQHDKVVILNKKEFSSALDRVATIVTEKIRAVRLLFEKGKLTLSALSQEFGSAVDEVDVDYGYDDSVSILFNAKYLSDVTSEISSQNIKISLTDQDTAILIQPVKEENDTEHDNAYFIVMPLKI
jgi:DNA polymerase-3 subunit beta